MSEEMKKNVNDEELNNEHLENVTGGDQNTGGGMSGSGGTFPPTGGRGGSKTMTVVCPACSNTVTVTVGVFSNGVTCPICKKTFIL